MSSQQLEAPELQGEHILTLSDTINIDHLRCSWEAISVVDYIALNVAIELTKSLIEVSFLTNGPSQLCNG